MPTSRLASRDQPSVPTRTVEPTTAARVLGSRRRFIEPVLTGRNGDGECGSFFRFLTAGNEAPDERPTRSGSMPTLKA